jgi:proline iminopeptidase
MSLSQALYLEVEQSGETTEDCVAIGNPAQQRLKHLYHASSRIRSALLRIAIVVLAVVVAEASASSTRGTSRDTGKIITHDGFALAYERIGQGAQTVIIPGRLFLADSLESLSSPHRTLVFYDMRNCGRSEQIADLSRISIENDVRDLEVVRQHFNAERFAAIGYSYLGLMVALYAVDHSERVERIVQLGPVPIKLGTTYAPELHNTKDRSVFDEKKWRELQQLERDGYIERRPREYCEREWRFLRVMLVSDPPRNLGRLQSPCEMPNEWPIHLRKHLAALFAGSIAKLDVSRAELAARVTMPVPTIHGRNDRNAPYGAGREWAQLLPNARLLTLDSAAHNSWADEPRIVSSAIQQFLTGSWPADAQRITR